MKANIFVDKDKIKIKGNKKNIIIPLNPRDGQPWEEPRYNDVDVQRLYQIMHNNEDIIKPNNSGEIHLGSPMSVKQNSDSELYTWKIEN